MSHTPTIIIRGLPPEDVHRLNKVLADISRDRGCRLTAGEGMYELIPTYKPTLADLARKVFCNPPAAHPNVVPMRRRPEPTFTPPTAA